MPSVCEPTRTVQVTGGELACAVLVTPAKVAVISRAVTVAVVRTGRDNSRMAMTKLLTIGSLARITSVLRRRNSLIGAFRARAARARRWHRTARATGTPRHVSQDGCALRYVPANVLGRGASIAVCARRR